MNIKKFLLILLVSSFGISAQAQSEIWLLNGQKKTVKNLEFSEDNLLIRYQNEKGRTKLISTKDVFSASTKDGKEYIFYKPTADMSVENMKEFMLGETQARQNYKAKGAFYSSIGVGIVSPFALGQLSSLLPLSYAITIGQINPKNENLAISNNSPYFESGYKHVVKKKRTINSLLGGSLGLIIGLTTVFLINE